MSLILDQTEGVSPASGVLRLERPLRLDSGARLEAVEIAFQTYGRLNPERSNAVLV